MRIFLIPGLMAATMLTPAAASAAEIAPSLNERPGLVQTDLTGAAALQRDGRAERRAERRADRNNRGQANIDLQTRGDRAEMRQNRRVDRVDRSLNNAPVQRTAPQDRNVNLAAQRNQRVDRNIDRRVERRQDIRQGDRNRDGRVDRRFDRNRDGNIDRRFDRNNNDRVDRRVDRNRDGRIDWRQDIRQGDRNRDGRVDRRYDRNRDGQIDRRFDRNDNDRIDRRVDRNRDGRIDQRYRDSRYAARSSRNWNHSWRNDRRYDWQRHRQINRSYYRLGRYYAPYRDYRYRRLSIGISLGSAFYGSRYWINNPGYYRLPAAYPGTRWIRYYDDVLLIDTYTGEVIDVIYDFFW